MKIPYFSQNLAGSVTCTSWTRIVEVGRHCWKLYRPKPCLKYQLEQDAQDHFPSGFEHSKGRDSISSLGNPCQCLTILTEICILPLDFGPALWCTSTVTPVDTGDCAPLYTIIADCIGGAQQTFCSFCAFFCMRELYSKAISYTGLFLALVEKVFDTPNQESAVGKMFKTPSDQEQLTEL